MSLITINYLSNHIIEEKKYYKFIKKNIDKVHHLRSLDSKICIKEQKFECYLFSELDNLKKFKQKVLINGDSWAEQIITHENINKKENNKITKFGNEFKLNFILAGISSYSPSVIHGQYNLLFNEYNINPTYIISIFDQSDIGDELCRYKELRYKNNDKIYVKNYIDNKYINDPFNYIRDLKLAEILYSNDVSFIKIIKFGYIKIKQRLEKKIIKKCPYKNISNILKKKLSKDDETYIISVLDDYINEVFKNEKLQGLYLVTHPHKQHLLGIYENDISLLVEESISRSIYKNKIKHLNFKKNFFEINDYVEDDASSHLNEHAFDRYIKKILEEFKKDIN